MKDINNTTNVMNILRKESSGNHYSNKVLQYRATKFAQNNNYLECSAKQGQALVAKIRCASADGTSIIENQPHLELYDSPRANPLRNSKELELGMRRQALNLAKLTNSTNSVCTISGRETTFPITFNCSAKINKIQENINRIAEAREAIVSTTLENTSHYTTSYSSLISNLDTIHSTENSISISDTNSDNIVRNITRALDYNLTTAYTSIFDTSAYTANSTSLNNFSDRDVYNTPRIGRDVTTASPISSAGSSLLNIGIWLLGGALTLGFIFLAVAICEHAHKRTRNSSSTLDAEQLLEGKGSKETKVKQRIPIFYNSKRISNSNNALLAKTINSSEEEEGNLATPPPLGKLRSLELAVFIEKPNGKHF